MLTIFTTQKPNIGLTTIHQANALDSWIKINAEAILINEVNEVGPMGLPYVKDVFGIGEANAKNDLLVYANADLILLRDIVGAMVQASNQFSHFLIVGQRWDVQLDSRINFGPEWAGDLRQEVANRAVLHSVSGKDWFGWARPLGLDIPPFVVGRAGWDNWLLDAALRAGIPVIDATQCVTAIHPNHDYSDGWLYDEAAQHNRSLCDVPANKGRISEATWIMLPDRIIRTKEILDSYSGYGPWLGIQMEHLPPDEQTRLKAIAQYRRLHDSD